MDKIIAFVLLLVGFPLIFIVLLITMIDLRCNPIFVQKRTVAGSRNFNFYKIRSMHKSAPNLPTGEFVDPSKYITRWGSLLRTYSIDELMNLVCIVRGDMNFIGPRPIMPCEVELIDMRLKNGIHSKPGVTGLAQINGRDMISLKRKVACERYYEMRKSSVILRIFILFKTLVIVLRKSGIKH